MSVKLQRSASMVDSLAQIRLDSLTRVREMEVADSMEMVQNIAREDSITRVVETTRYVYGADATVTVDKGVGLTEDVVVSLTQSSSYALLVMVLALIYLIWLSHVFVRGTVRWSQLKTLGRERGIVSRGREVVGQQQMLMRVLSWVLGLSMIALLAVKMADIYIGITTEIGGAIWVVGASVVVTLCALYGWVFIKAAGYLTINVEAMRELLAIRRRLFVLSILFLAPVVMMLAMATFEQSTTVVYILVFEGVIFVGLFIWQTFLLFMRQNFSILHWILYLCAVELMPLSLIWGVVRHLNL